MSVKFKIQDGTGKPTIAGVTESNAVRVSLVNSSAANFTTEELTRNKLLKEYFSQPSGNILLNVDGSLFNQFFTLRSKVGYVQYITSLRFIFNDGNMDINTSGQLRRFGDAATSPGLTNGILMYADQNGVITNIFNSPIRSLADFFNYVDDFTNFVDGISNGVDLLTLDFKFDVPIVLTSGTVDTITVVIRDNLLPVDLFTIVARGYQEQI